ncbi:MAG: putative quinol monooxygenase [Candidatus Tectimicrobiota bacterium]
MHKPIAWQVELAVRPGALDAFRALTVEMVAATRQEPGVLCYERFISPDGRLVHVYERYADSAAALAHLHAFARQFGTRFAALVERQRFTVYGTPSAELRALLDGFGARYLRLLDGFVQGCAY